MTASRHLWNEPEVFLFDNEYIVWYKENASVVAQLVELGSVKPSVAGSKPAHRAKGCVVR